MQRRKDDNADRTRRLELGKQEYALRQRLCAQARQLWDGLVASNGGDGTDSRRLLIERVELLREDLNRYLAGAPLPPTFAGSRFVDPVPGVTLGCISPEARDLLDTVMDEWEKHVIEAKKIHGEKYKPEYYGFAYWLIRWSGLIQPAQKQVKFHGGQPR
jgi:hypothetical protein